MWQQSQKALCEVTQTQPVSIILVFSGFFRKAMRVRSAEGSPASDPCLDTTETVVGGTFLALRATLDMMLFWCSGFRTIPDFGGNNMYVKLYGLRDAARWLEMPAALIDCIEFEIDELPYNALPAPEDLIAIYASFPVGHKARFKTLELWADWYIHDRREVDLDELFGEFEQLLQDMKDAVKHLREWKEIKEEDRRKALSVVEKKVKESEDVFDVEMYGCG